MSRILARGAIPALLFFAMTACGDDPLSADDRAAALASDDVATSTGEAIATDVALLLSAEVDAIGVGGAPMMSLTAETAPSGCTQQSDGRFTCSSRTQGDVTWSRTFTFYDGTTVQDGYDPVTTDSIVFETSVTGSASRGGYTAEFSRERHATLSGLDGEETQRTWNGAGASSRSETWTGDRGTRTYVVTSSDSVRNVVLNLPRAENPWPASGVVVHRVEMLATFSGAAGEGSREFSRRVQVTFNGTSVVPLLINDRECELNLATRQVSCP